MDNQKRRQNLKVFEIPAIWEFLISGGWTTSSGTSRRTGVFVRRSSLTKSSPRWSMRLCIRASPRWMQVAPSTCDPYNRKITLRYGHPHLHHPRFKIHPRSLTGLGPFSQLHVDATMNEPYPQLTHSAINNMYPCQFYRPVDGPVVFALNNYLLTQCTV